MTNVDKIQRLKAIAELKAEYHKGNIKEFFEENKLENELIKLLDGSVGMIHSAKQVYSSVKEIRDNQNNIK